MGMVLLFGLTLLVSVNSFASVDYSGESIAQSEEQAIRIPQARLNGIYVTPKAHTEVIPMATLVNGKWVENSKGAALELVHAGQSAHLAFQQDGSVIVQLPPNPKNLNEAPQKIWLTEDQFVDAGLKFSSSGDASNLSSYLNTEFAARTFGEPGTVKYVHTGYRASYYINGKWAAGGCLAYVMNQVGWNRPGGVGGSKGFVSVLRSMGWRGGDPRRPTANMVCAWDRGPHVAIWQNGCWMYDRGCSDAENRGQPKYCVSRG